MFGNFARRALEIHVVVVVVVIGMGQLSACVAWAFWVSALHEESFLGILAHIYPSFVGNHGKLWTARSTSVTEDWISNLPVRAYYHSATDVARKSRIRATMSILTSFFTFNSEFVNMATLSFAYRYRVYLMVLMKLKWCFLKWFAK